MIASSLYDITTHSVISLAQVWDHQPRCEINSAGVRSLPSGVRLLNVRSLGHGLWSLASGLWLLSHCERSLGHSARSLVHGVNSLASGLWLLGHSVRLLVHSVRLLGHSVRSLGYYVRSLAHRVRTSAHRRQARGVPTVSGVGSATTTRRLANTAVASVRRSNSIPVNRLIDSGIINRQAGAASLAPHNQHWLKLWLITTKLNVKFISDALA